MVRIRTAQPQDVVKTNEICIETADERLKRNARMARITSLLFSEYYITKESENCFVLEYEGEVVGYILSACRLGAFCRSYRGDIFRQVAKLSPAWGAACLFIPAKYVLMQRKYPAHLHIDILPPYQSSGYGSRLMDTLLAHLKENGVRGVCLSCGANNTRAVRFYRKYGFKVKLRAFGGLLMAKKL